MSLKSVLQTGHVMLAPIILIFSPSDIRPFDFSPFDFRPFDF